MPATRNSSFSTLFQQIFAAFCVFIADSCILLFFPKPASKFKKLLIATDALSTNRFQTNFDSNVAIRTFDHEPSAPKNKPFQTICFPLRPLRLCGEFAFVLAAMLTLLSTNRIQREFLFNNCIQSQNKISYSGLFGKIQTFSNFRRATNPNATGLPLPKPH
jgi:hypothetical protein